MIVGVTTEEYARKAAEELGLDPDERWGDVNNLLLDAMFEQELETKSRSNVLIHSRNREDNILIRRFDMWIKYLMQAKLDILRGNYDFKCSILRRVFSDMKEQIDSLLKRTKACGNPDCNVSTGICGSLTFGYGELDDNGYWEYPCEICEEHYYENRDKVSK